MHNSEATQLNISMDSELVFGVNISTENSSSYQIGWGSEYARYKGVLPKRWDVGFRKFSTGLLQ